MADFSTLQSQLRDAEATIENGKRDVFLASERVKRLEVRKQLVARSHGEDSDAFAELDAAQTQWQESIATGRRELADAVKMRQEFEAALVRINDRYASALKRMGA